MFDEHICGWICYFLDLGFPFVYCEVFLVRSLHIFILSIFRGSIVFYLFTWGLSMLYFELSLSSTLDFCFFPSRSIVGLMIIDRDVWDCFLMWADSGGED